MNLRKRIVLLLAFLLTLQLTACGSNHGVDSHPDPNSPYAIGDIVSLGGLDWLVLDVQDGQVLVISESVLSQRAWHPEQKSLSWEISEIRQYLNGPFFEDSFTDEERGRIIETEVINNANPRFGAAGPGRDTMDRVFLLSVEEVIQYFGDSGRLENPEERDAILTDEYDSLRVARHIETDSVSWWWLRTPGHHLNPLLHASAAVVGGAGEVFLYGIYVISDGGGVRPVLWLRV